MRRIIIVQECPSNYAPLLEFACSQKNDDASPEISIFRNSVGIPGQV